MFVFVFRPRQEKKAAAAGPLVWCREKLELDSNLRG
jgi:hypothetical protein